MSSQNILRLCTTGLICAILTLGLSVLSSDNAYAQVSKRSSRKKNKKTKVVPMDSIAVTPTKPDTITTMSGLRYIDYEAGTGKSVESGMMVKVDYAGFLTNGKLFDTSIEAIAKQNQYDRGGMPFEPLSFRVGTGQVIKGWDEGLTTNLKVGGRRRLIIPAALAYGSRGAGNVIPPNATLIFDVKVVDAE